MTKFYKVFIFLSVMVYEIDLKAQIKAKEFGSGIEILGKDSSFFTHIGLRIQNQFSNKWDLKNDDIYQMDNYVAEMLIRRCRIKMDGWFYSPKIFYKFELGLSNKDRSGAGTPEFSNASNMIYDAVIGYHFYKNLSIQYGQTKLSGNRERVISSGNLQFVDRSLMNSKFNLDRDMGFQLKNHHKIGKQFIIKEIFAFSQGEGRNVTAGNFNGFEYTYRIEFLPFGNFAKHGDYSNSAIEREQKPKLSLGFTYDNNNNSVRTNGNLGSFIKDENGQYFGKNLNTFFGDLMFKYKKISIMAEYADRKTKDNNPNVYNDTMAVLGTFVSGAGYNFQAGYMFDNNIEIAGRTTFVNLNNGIKENQYTIALSKFIVGHQLKIQTDLTYIQKEKANDGIMLRMQMDLLF